MPHTQSRQGVKCERRPGCAEVTVAPSVSPRCTKPALCSVLTVPSKTMHSLCTLLAKMLAHVMPPTEATWQLLGQITGILKGPD